MPGAYLTKKPETLRDLSAVAELLAFSLLRGATAAAFAAETESVADKRSAEAVINLVNRTTKPCGGV